jgi:hypothetical protein
VGRPAKLTADLHVTLVNAVRLGTSLPVAAAYMGLSPHTVKEWVRRGEGWDGRPTTGLYATFAVDIKRAQAADEVRRIARLEEAARGGKVLARKTKTTEVLNAQGEVVKRWTEERYSEPQWTADAWFLERSYPDRWGRRERVDVRLQIERVVQHVAHELGLQPEELLAEAEALLREMDHGQS